MNRPKVTFTATPLVWIEVLGEKPDAGQANRDDGGLIWQLQALLAYAKIEPLRSPLGVASTGRYAFAFTPTDAAKVTAWLNAHAVPTTAAGTGET